MYKHNPYRYSSGHTVADYEEFDVKPPRSTRKDPNAVAKMKLANRRKKLNKSKQERPDSLYVPTVSLAINEDKYSRGNVDYCAKAIVPISQIEAMVIMPIHPNRIARKFTPGPSSPYGPDHDGFYCYKLLLRSGKEMDVWNKMNYEEMQTYLFDYTRWKKTHKCQSSSSSSYSSSESSSSSCSSCESSSI